MKSIVFAGAAILMMVAATGCAVQPGDPGGTEGSGSTSSAATTGASPDAKMSPDTARPTIQALTMGGTQGSIGFSGSGFAPGGQALIYVSNSNGSWAKTETVNVTPNLETCFRGICRSLGGGGSISGSMTGIPCNMVVDVLAIDDSGLGESNVVTIRAECSS